MLAALQGQLGLGLALRALEAEHDLLGRLGLLVEHGLGLTTVTGLLSVVTALSLGEQRCLRELLVPVVKAGGGICIYLAGLVLGDLVLGVLLAVPALAVGAASLGNVDLEDASQLLSC